MTNQVIVPVSNVSLIIGTDVRTLRLNQKKQYRALESDMLQPKLCCECDSFIPPEEWCKSRCIDRRCITKPVQLVGGICYARDAREASDSCGVSGRYWKPKLEVPKQKSWWRKLI